MVGKDKMKRKAVYHHRTQATDAQGIHINEMVKALGRHGVEVKMVALVKDEALGKESREGILGKITDLLPGLIYEIMEMGFNAIGFLRLYRSVVKEEPAFIYERYSIYNLVGLLVSKFTGVPLILEVNAPLALEKKRYGSLYFPKLAQHIETLIINHAFKTIAVTRVLKEILVENGADPRKIQVMPNGINPEDFPVCQPKPAKDETILGFIGWFRDWHGLAELVESYAQRQWHKKGIHLLLVGDGPLRPELDQAIAKHGLGKTITITGAVSRNRLGIYLDQMDIALQPAATSYASPMKLMEYMAGSKAIVAPDQANIREVLTHGQDAMLFKPDDIDDLCDKVEILVSDRSRIRFLGEASRRTLETRPLTWDENARQVIHLIPGLKQAKI